MDQVNRFCTNCGHQLNVGRYCTNCGVRVPSTRDAAPRQQPDYPTAVRTDALPPIPAAPPLPPPPPPVLGPAPSSARYPLYADAVQPPLARAAPPPADPASYDALPSRRRSAAPWLFAVLALLVLALVGGGLLLLAPSGDDAVAGDEAGRGDGGQQGAPVTTLEPADVTAADVAPASVDEDGNRVTFEPTNMLDGDPRTSWRMSGDGTGSVVTFSFDEPVTVTEVGLINGYAKTDPPHDWYAGNRRITLVVWAFDDGTEVEQELGDDPSVQTVRVGGVETASIELRILEVTEPGDGPDGRDFTAISEIEVAGPA